MRGCRFRAILRALESFDRGRITELQLAALLESYVETCDWLGAAP